MLTTANQAGVDDDVREFLAEDHLKRLCKTIWENESEEDIQLIIDVDNQDHRDCMPDHEEVGNPLREGGSSTANLRDRSNSASPTDAELAMRMGLTWAEGKTVLIHCNRGEHRAPSAVEQVDNLRQRSLGGVVQSGGSSSSSGRGRVANPEHAVVQVTDWYAPHLREDAVTSPILFIGGGTTGVAAVCDEMPHRFLAQRHRSQQPMGSGGYGARN